MSKTDHSDKLSCTWLVKLTSVIEAASKLGTQFSSLICVEDMSELADPPSGPLPAELGDPLHPITAGERLLGQWWAAGFVTLAVTACDPGVARQPAGSPGRPGRELGVGIGEGNEPERAPTTTGRWRTTRKRGDATVHSPRLELAGSQPEQMLYVDLETGTLQGGLFIKRSHGWMWFQQCGRQVEEVFAHRS